MKNLNNYITEKFKIDKDIKNTSYAIENNKPNDKDLISIANDLFNTGEHSGFRKGVDRTNMSVNDFIEDIHRYDDDPDYEEYGEIIKKFAKEYDAQKISVLFGTGYDDRWATVVFFQTRPYYYFIVYHSHYGSSEFIKAENADDAFDKICDFVL